MNRATLLALVVLGIIALLVCQDTSKAPAQKKDGPPTAECRWRTNVIKLDGIINEVVIGGPMSEALLRTRVEDIVK